MRYLKTVRIREVKEIRAYCTKFGDMPRATAAPPIVYSRIRAQPINQATLETIIIVVMITLFIWCCLYELRKTLRL